MGSAEKFFGLSAQAIRWHFELKQLMTANYIPPKPPDGILDVFKTDSSYPTILIECGHTLYAKPELFVDHILWCLHKSCDSKEHPMELFRFLCGRHSICTNCIILLLSKVTFKDLISIYSICNRDLFIKSFNSEQTRSQGALCDILYMQLFCHPKMRKILMKTCTMNKRMYLKGQKTKKFFEANNRKGFVHDFHFICTVVIEQAGSKLLSNNGISDHSDYFYGMKMTYLGILYRSMKYWNKYHLLFFVKYCVLKLDQSFAYLLQLSHKNDNVLLTMAVCLINWIFIAIYHKSIKLQHNKTQDRNVWNVLKKHQKMQDNQTKNIESYRQCQLRNETCSYNGCGKMQKNVDEDFKVCRQCKMAYYCSKQCQKRSWNADHRNICKTLSKYYSFL